MTDAHMLEACMATVGVCRVSHLQSHLWAVLSTIPFDVVETTPLFKMEVDIDETVSHGLLLGVSQPD